MPGQDDDGVPTTLRFTPFFNGYWEGSLMSEDVPTRYLFGWLIAQSQRPGANGVVDVPKSHIARTLNMPLEQVEHGIARLMKPDPESRCKEEGGRRIVPLDPTNSGRGWRLVANKDYRDALHNLFAASRMARKRAHQKADVPDVPSVPDVPKGSHDTKTKTKTKTIRREEGTPLPPGAISEEAPPAASRPARVRVHFTPPSVEEVRAFSAEKGLTLDPSYFVDAYAQKGWMAGKVPMKDWHAAARNAARDGWTMRNRNGIQPIVAPNPTQNPESVSSARQAEVARELAEERAAWAERHK